MKLVVQTLLTCVEFEAIHLEMDENLTKDLEEEMEEIQEEKSKESLEKKLILDFMSTMERDVVKKKG